ncbi:MAG TPA: aromatic-ring-hydroxylating dioxygenase subunit beta [Burkholderiaceae bacterium]|nr:aromatic-ring-hydroxylating dioxygenase subunit beta [Burkholderiaceae bacterium]
MTGAAPTTAERLAELVYLEARLIDERRWEEWYALYADDGVYWVPLAPGQPDRENHTSLMDEDKLLLRLRIERFSNPRSFSLHPPVRCLHVLQRPELESADEAAGTWTMRTNELYVETQGEAQIVLAAVVRHTIATVDGAPRIRLKRVDLLNCDAALPSIQLFP